MKKLVLLITLCTLSYLASSQWSFRNNSQHWSNDHLLYAHGSFVTGNSNGGDIGLNFVYNSKISMSVGYSNTSKQFAAALPETLKSAEEAGSITQPTTSVDNMDNFYCILGRSFNLNTKKPIRFLIQGGPGLSYIMNIPDKDNFSFKTANRRSEISLVVNSKIEFPVSDVLCLSFGPSCIINKAQSFYGAGIGISYGIVKSSLAN